jgi:hypothetical protein
LQTSHRAARLAIGGGVVLKPLGWRRLLGTMSTGPAVALQLIAERSAVLESYLETLPAADRAAVAAALPALRKLTRKRPPRG